MCDVFVRIRIHKIQGFRGLKRDVYPYSFGESSKSNNPENHDSDKYAMSLSELGCVGFKD